MSRDFEETIPIVRDSAYTTGREPESSFFLSKVGSSMIDATERKITLFGIDQGLQVMATLVSTLTA